MRRVSKAYFYGWKYIEVFKRLSNSSRHLVNKGEKKINFLAIFIMLYVVRKSNGVQV